MLRQCFITTWYFALVITLAAGLAFLPSIGKANADSSVEGSFTVALTISDVSASNIGYYSATISWKTNGDATSQVFYDTTSHDNIADYTYHTDNDTDLASEHSLNLAGLSVANTYHYRVKSVATIDGVEFIATSENYTFRTRTLRPAADGGAPSPAPALYIATNFFGTKGRSPISTTGEILETITVTSENGMTTFTIFEGTHFLDKDGNLPYYLEISVDENPPPAPEGFTHVGQAYKVEPEGNTFNDLLLIEWRYDPADFPEGVTEERLRLMCCCPGFEDHLLAAFETHHEGHGSCPGMECTVDTENNIAIGECDHCRTFALFGYKVVVPPVVPPTPPVVPPVIPPVPPAAFTASHLSISPSEVYIGESVSIRVIVANIGGEPGSYNVTLKINGMVEATKEVTVNTGLNKEVTLTISKDIAGTYSVAVDGLTGSFIVKEELVPQAPEIPPAITEPFNLLLIVGIAAGVLVVGMAILLVVVLRRRRQY